MAKKFILLIVVLMLTITGNYISVHASNPADNLDNRYQTENTAGITMNQINEMSANSPNSLTPIQGLMLWMFAILAFLKLAQKMDNLLQSLGLNVTQTGGRAVGDLLVAGMALRNAGSLISKSMGMFGFGGGGSGGAAAAAGGTGSRSGAAATGSGTSSAGGRGPTPIPTSSPGSGPVPVGGSPGGTSPGGSTTPGGTSSATPGGGSPSGGSSTTTPTTTATPSGSSSSSTATGSPPASSGASTSGTGSSAAGTSSRNPVGRAVNWMREDGAWQGAIKAGAKGGAIGLGAYGAKIGAAKVGGTVSSRLAINGNTSNPTENAEANNNCTPPISQQPVNQGDTGTASSSSGENHGEYQDSRPLNETDSSLPILTTINNEEYQDTNSTDNSATSDESGRVPASFNSEVYQEADSVNTTADTSPIPTSISGADTQFSEADSDADNTDGTGSGSSSYAIDSGETWNDSKPIDASTGAVPIPAARNNEGWNETTPSGDVPSSVANADTATPATMPQAVVPTQSTASIPATPTQTESVTPLSAAPQGTTAAVAAVPSSGVQPSAASADSVTPAAVPQEVIPNQHPNIHTILCLHGPYIYQKF